MNYLIFMSIIGLFNALILHPIKAEIKSFGFDLLHHDSIFSPFHNQSVTESELSRKSFLRSLNRLKQFNSSMHMDGKFSWSDLTNEGGDYLTTMYIGKPEGDRDVPIKLLAYPSMSDDLTWVQCFHCSNWEYQHKLLYDPKKSDTYLPLDPSSRDCYTTPYAYGESDVCKYQYPSGNGNFDSNGVLSTETFFLKSSDELKKEFKEFSEIVFGCDEKHGCNFKHGVQAVVGLGPAGNSMVSQLGKTIGKKFTYCLVRQSLSHRSKIFFGSEIDYYGHPKYQAEIYVRSHPSYHLNLEAVSINSNKISIPYIDQRFMRLDIQTALTTLRRPLYNQFLTVFIAEAGRVTPIQNPEYGTCFDKRELSRIRVPKLKFHFTGAAGFESDAEFHLHPENLLIDIGDNLCLTIVPKDEPYSVLGNMAQVDVQMIFDPPNHVLTFAPRDCARFSP